MPRKRKTALSKRASKARRVQEARSEESDRDRSVRQEADQQRHARSRSQETDEARSVRLEADQQRHTRSRAQETDEARLVRLEADQQRHTRRRAREAAAITLNWYKAAFDYNSTYDYASHKNVAIGRMDILCSYCGAKKWKGESPGLCCSGGKVCLPCLPEPPDVLKTLLTGESPDSKHFQKFVWKYNACFQMTSFGAEKDLTDRGFFTTFKIQGQCYHLMGSLLPLPNEEAKFVQVYFMGNAEDQANQRCRNISGVRQDIILNLQHMIHQSHAYIGLFKYALEHMNEQVDHKIVIRADKRPAGEHERRYNAPTTNDVAIIMVNEDQGKRDIVLRQRDGQLMRINETHRAYDSLQYPLLFWEGNDGYNFAIPQYEPQSGDYHPSKRVSCRQFYAYQMMVREDNFNHILRFKEVTSQFLVDMFAKVESERLLFIRLNQKKLRAEDYIHLRDAINVDGTGQSVGQRVILPSSFTGSARYMHERCQDAMAYVRKYGRPDLFLTFTANPKSKEIMDELFEGQTPVDRHDVIARVFHEKQKKLIWLLKEGKIFGSLNCLLYTIEWQKRGLPHSHTLIWCKDKIHPSDIDKIITAELPDPARDPELYDVVRTQMIHGPCGALNPSCPCMNEERKCSKRYPRNFLKETETGEDGYPSYRRRQPEDGGFTTRMKIRGRGDEVTVDNRWVVPYNPMLCKIFKSHINVECCNSIKSIKYVTKYVMKGSDMAVFNVERQEQTDEVSLYQSGRYISSNEAAWRILGFDIHQRFPTVVNLSVHLENGQRVYYTEENARLVAECPPETTLTAFFKLCQHDNFAKTLLYQEVPTYYTWAANKSWQRRKNGQRVQEQVFASDAIGRVYTVHPNNAECFFLRLLLHTVKGPTSFEDLRSYEGEICVTYREACLRHGLLEDDEHWNQTLSEAAAVQMPCQLRQLFAIMLQFCHPSNPVQLWEDHKESLAEDFYNVAKRQNPTVDVAYTDFIFNKALRDIRRKIQAIGGDGLYGLPEPGEGDDDDNLADYMREVNYDANTLSVFCEENEGRLTDDQRRAFQSVMQSVNQSQGRLFFLDAPGGTGKTFVTNLLLAKVRQSGRIALAVASSGIAATLLEGGRTAHSAFKLPLDLYKNDTPTCNVKRGTATGRVLKESKLIIWDEATMSHKLAFEALDKTLQDIRQDDRPFGGVTLLMCGDFRQTLPVIPKSTRADELKACIKSSHLWPKVQRLTLQTNMRVHLHGDEQAADFSAKLLAIGDGRQETDEHGQVELTFGHNVANFSELIQAIYPNLGAHYKNADWLLERTILAPKNIHVNVINTRLMGMLPGEEKLYKSIDGMADADEAVQYPVEFLNSLDPPGMPPHKLALKVGAPIMLLRNLDAPRLCNGTRLIIKQMLPHVLDVMILTGKARGQMAFIPRIPIIPSDLPFRFKRLQFPIKPAFGMTINKSQGQSLKVVGINLEEPPFSHGQLYVAASRVGNPDNVFLLMPGAKTTNVVYKEALN